MATVKERRELAESGITSPVMSGGIPKTKYYTPDGREILAIPNVRGFYNRETKETGTRDANLDKGWLLAPPEHPILHCPGCDQWHATQAEVDDCVAKKQAFQAKWDRQALKMHKDEATEIDQLKGEVSELKSDMKEIKELLMKLAGG